MARDNEALEDIFSFFLLVTCSLPTLTALSRILRPQRLIRGDPLAILIVQSGGSPAFYHRYLSYKAMFQHFLPQKEQLHLE